MAKHFDEKERQHIIAQLRDVGHAEFTRRGLRAARIEDICRNVGISKGSFYNFFPAKEQLFLSIIEQRERVHRASMMELVAGFAGKEAQLLNQLFEIIVSAIQTDPFIAVMQQPGEMEHLARKIGAEQLAEHQASDFEFFAELTKTMQANGYCINAQQNTLAEIAVLIFCTSMQSELLPPETLAAAFTQLKDLMHFKLSSKGA